MWRACSRARISRSPSAAPEGREHHARLLAQMGVEVSLDDRLGLSLRAERLSDPFAPYDLVRPCVLRSWFSGRSSRAARGRVSLPGGWPSGARPVDLHIKDLKR